MRFAPCLLLAVIVSIPGSAAADGPPCRPCVGLSAEDPLKVAAAIAAAPPLSEGSRLYVRWPQPVDRDGLAEELAAAVAAAGAVPWPVLVFSTPPPLAEHESQLAAELARAARLAAASPPLTHFEIAWSHSVTAADGVRDYAFLLKRASVAVRGALASARILTQPLAPDPATLEPLYAEEVAAYLDGVTIRTTDPGVVAGVRTLIDHLDPGRPLVTVGHELGSDAFRALPEIADAASQGAAVSFLEAPAAGALPDLRPLLLLAEEFRGDLVFDPASTPTGVTGGWAFVRAEDLGLRVIIDTGGIAGATARFPDPSLRRPQLVALDGATTTLDARPGSAALAVDLPDGHDVLVLRLERPTAAELGGFGADLDIAGRRDLPVEEILRRLQEFEDAQARRLEHYEATYTQHLRFRPGEGLEPIEASFAGPFFFSQGDGFDWAWQRFQVNGVRWRGRIPELPLLQPAKAAELPLEITFDRSYRYRLKGTDTIDGRDCWEVEFEPADLDQPEARWRGTVWIDRQVYARVRTRALQLGLAGDVLSNEETMQFAPLDADGRPAEWSPSSFVLPVRVVGQELQSILNTPVQVVKESLLTEVRVNREGFSERLAAAHASEDTMLRDTPDGLRYLERQEDGSRVVQENLDESRLFMVGGTYWDESYDFPLPLVGLNWFSSDVRGTGTQANVFFAGVLVNLNWADPAAFGSRWDVGARAFGLAIAGEETPYRDGVESPGEAVESRPATLALYAGHPLGSFAKLDLTYRLDWDWYGRAEDTDDDFVAPSSTLTQSLGAELSYSRAGYRLGLSASTARRGEWDPWGRPTGDDWDPAHRDFLRWKAALTKTWWFGSFTKLGVGLEHLDGEDLDRFSKYDFEYFGDTRIAGYQRGLVTASSGDAAHLTFGVSLAELLRVELRGDAAWATDRQTGLDRELLAGVSLNGTVIGPWQTVVNFDLGIPVSGPADGVTVFVAFLKLFD